MAHFKRKRPKSRRAGCLMCKPHKANWLKDSVHALKPRDRREKERLDEQMRAGTTMGSGGEDRAS